MAADRSTSLFMNQWSGINLVVYYMPTVLVVNVGMAPQKAQLVAGFVELMFVVGDSFSNFTVDRVGRKKLLMAGCAGCGLSMMLIATVSHDYPMHTLNRP